MGRPKRLYPLGKYRLRTPWEADKEKAYPVELEYTWNRQATCENDSVYVGDVTPELRTVIFPDTERSSRIPTLQSITP